MFILDGIVYASERPETVQIVSVKPLDDMMLLLTFSTGEQRLFDATVLTLSLIHIYFQKNADYGKTQPFYPIFCCCFAL